MNRDRAKELWPIMKAFSEGKEIQTKSTYDNTWMSWNEFSFDSDSLEYRIKPEPRVIEIFDGDQLQIHITSNRGYDLKYIEGPCKFIEVLEDD